MYDCSDEDSVPFYWDCEVRHRAALTVLISVH